MSTEIKELEERLKNLKATENIESSEIKELSELSDINLGSEKEVKENFKFKIDNEIYTANIVVNENQLINIMDLGEIFKRFEKKKNYIKFLEDGLFKKIKNFNNKNISVIDKNGELVEFDDTAVQLHLFSACIKLITPRLSELQNK